MGRKRSNYVCPRCKEVGYLRQKYVWNTNYPHSSKERYRYHYVVHYNHVTTKRRECYVSKRDLMGSSMIQNLSDNQLMNGMVQVINALDIKIDKLLKKFPEIYAPEIHGSKSDLITFKILKLFIEQENNIILLRNFIERHAGVWGTDLKRFTISYAESQRKLLIPLIKQATTSLKNLIIKVSNRYKYKIKEHIMKGFGTTQKAVVIFLRKGYYLQAVYRLILEFYYVKNELPRQLLKKKEISSRLSESAFGSDKYKGIIG